MSLLNKNLPSCLSIAFHPKVLALTAVPTTIGLIVTFVRNMPKTIETTKKIKGTADKFMKMYKDNIASFKELPVNEDITKDPSKETNESEDT